MKSHKILFWIATGLLSAMMLMSAGMYLFNYDEVATIFTSLGYPIFIIKPLAVAKILGVIAILTRANKFLQGMAYAGFFYDFVLALTAHLHAGDGQFAMAAVALVLLGASYVYSKKLA